MKELIVAGYPTAHTALLVRAVLSRQQDELLISDNDVAVLSRERTDLVTIQEPVNLRKKNPADKSFWKQLARLLFPHAGDTVDTQVIESSLTSIGIHDLDLEKIEQAMPVGSTSILILSDKDSADRITGTISGFQGIVFRIQLQGENPRAVLQTVQKAG